MRRPTESTLVRQRAVSSNLAPVCCCNCWRLWISSCTAGSCRVPTSCILLQLSSLAWVEASACYISCLDGKCTSRQVANICAIRFLKSIFPESIGGEEGDYHTLNMFFSLLILHVFDIKLDGTFSGNRYCARHYRYLNIAPDKTCGEATNYCKLKDKY